MTTNDARCKQAWTDREGIICPWLCLICKHEVSQRTWVGSPSSIKRTDLLD